MKMEQAKLHTRTLVNTPYSKSSSKKEEKQNVNVSFFICSILVKIIPITFPMA